MRGLLAACLAFIAVGVAYPLGWLLYRSLAAAGGGLTLEHWRRCAGNPFLAPAVSNSLWLSAAATLLAVSAALGFALLSERTDFPGRSWLRAAALSPLFTSQSVLAVAWALLAGRSGPLHSLCAAAGFELSVYSMTGMALVSAASTLPFAFLVLEASVRSVGAEHAEAAAVCGASPARALRAVWIPLLLPGLGAAALLCFLLSSTLFGVHGLLGIPAGVWTVTNLLYTQLSLYSSEPGEAAALGFWLVCAGLAVLLLQRAVLPGGGAAGLSGRSGAPRRRRLAGWSAAAACAASLGAAAALLVLPWSALLARSLTPRAGAWSLDAYRALFSDPALRRALAHSAALAAAAAPLCCAVGLGAAYLVARARPRGAGLARLLCVAPMAFSGLVLAVAYIYAFSQPPLALYGTLWMFLLLYAARELPVSFLAGEAALAQLHPELEEQAAVCGGGPAAVARRVLWPLLRPAAYGAASLVFLAAFREMEASSILAGVGTEVFGYQVFSGFQRGALEEVSAMGVVGGLAGLAAGGALYRAAGGASAAWWRS
ncbi:MAG: iron ABC transporter permease [Elusimicrobia bacterium]|nr:iron ABC transporter permease [Elusimicrobiota bacterium]